MVYGLPPTVSPAVRVQLAVPVMLEIGRETVYGEASEQLLAAAEAERVKEAMQ